MANDPTTTAGSHDDRCASLLGQGCDCRSPWAACESALHPTTHEGPSLFCERPAGHNDGHESEFYGRVANFEPEVVATVRWPNRA